MTTESTQTDVFVVFEDGHRLKFTYNGEINEHDLFETPEAKDAIKVLYSKSQIKRVDVVPVELKDRVYNKIYDEYLKDPKHDTIDLWEWLIINLSKKT